MNILICNVGSTSLKYQLYVPAVLNVLVLQKVCSITKTI